MKFDSVCVRRLHISTAVSARDGSISTPLLRVFAGDASRKRQCFLTSNARTIGNWLVRETDDVQSNVAPAVSDRDRCVSASGGHRSRSELHLPSLFQHVNELARGKSAAEHKGSV